MTRMTRRSALGIRLLAASAELALPAGTASAQEESVWIGCAGANTTGAGITAISNNELWVHEVGEARATMLDRSQRPGQIAGTMSWGEQEMAPLVRARSRDTNLTVLVAEPNSPATLALADVACLVEDGRITGSDPAVDLRSDPAVVRAFLGGATACVT
ncbi:hypothetical protein [Palleronia sp.]|uniref:hypothetical protein n=1 Tax=Palleronia sp. TaxID=1940284 RepID=UPI0035C84D5C